MLSPVVVNIFSLLPLLFTIYLAKRHIVRAPENRYYIGAAGIVIVLLLSEIANYFLSGKLQILAFVLHMLCYVLEFSLTPLVPVLLLLYLGFSKLTRKKLILFLIPLFSNIVLSTLSVQTGWLFSITEENLYTRGPFFFIITLVSAYYFLLVIARIFSQKNDLCPSRGLLSAVYTLPIAATVLQLVTFSYSYIFSTMAISLLLYYVIMQECRFAFDVQTKVRNRIAFEQDMHALQASKRDATIFMCDVNNLKQTNDSWGHQEGDASLSTLASLLNTTFLRYGKVYRIGGDEFCVLLPIQRDIGLLIEEFRKNLLSLNESLAHAIDVAYGFAQSDIAQGVSLTQAYNVADDAMYTHKASQKKQRLH